MTSPGPRASCAWPGPGSGAPPRRPPPTRSAKASAWSESRIRPPSSCSVPPAIFQLWRTNLLPHEFAIVGIGRRPYTDEAFRAELRTSLDQFSRVLPIETAVWEEFARRICYQRGNFNEPSQCDQLAARLDDLDRERGTAGNRLYYLATQPSAFAEIIA